MTWLLLLLAIWAAGMFTLGRLLPKPVAPPPDPIVGVHFFLDRDTGGVLKAVTRRDPMTGLTLTTTTNLGKDYPT